MNPGWRHVGLAALAAVSVGFVALCVGLGRLLGETLTAAEQRAQIGSQRMPVPPEVPA